MRCPKCSHSKTAIIETRIRPDGVSVLRRRECVQCKFRFSTTEVRVITHLRKEFLLSRIEARLKALREGLIHDIVETSKN